MPDTDTKAPTRQEIDSLLRRARSEPTPVAWSPSSKRRSERQSAYREAIADREAAIERLRSFWWSRDVLIWVISLTDQLTAESFFADEIRNHFRDSWQRSACIPCGRLIRSTTYLLIRDEGALDEGRQVPFEHFSCPSCGRWDTLKTFTTRLEWITDTDSTWEIATDGDTLIVNYQRCRVKLDTAPTWYLDPTADDATVNILLEALAARKSELPAPGRCLVPSTLAQNASRLLQDAGFSPEQQSFTLTPHRIDPKPDSSLRVIITTIAGDGSPGDDGPVNATRPSRMKRLLIKKALQLTVIGIAYFLGTIARLVPGNNFFLDLVLLISGLVVILGSLVFIFDWGT
jgi:hypothetical protein